MSSEYKLINGKAGKRYLKDGRLVSVKDVPKDVLQNLTEDNVVGEQGVKPTPNSEPCIFCGKWGNLTRFVNGKTIVLCSGHFYSQTIGQCAEQLRKESYA